MLHRGEEEVAKT